MSFANSTSNATATATAAAAGRCDTLIRNALVIDGTGADPVAADVAVTAGRIAAIGQLSGWQAHATIDASGRVLSPGFIDVHTHDDTNVIRTPEMFPKLSQGVTTVVVGNCGISAAPVSLKGDPPDPMNLLGKSEAFHYPTFASYVAAVDAAQPSINVAALVGHTALRNNHMDRLDRAASEPEIAGMRAQLREALEHGALGLSTGLAYGNAINAPTAEVLALAEPLAEFGAMYATHLRSEFADILEAMDEAFRIGKHARVPVVISHLKCAGVENWGRSGEVLKALELAGKHQHVGCDCYPYTASSSTLDLKQVTDAYDIQVTWSEPHPEQGGKMLKQVAAEWQLDLHAAAARLMPAGAVYHCMADDDVNRILSHPATVIGSDGLPNDPLPHPRLWGAFPRVLGYYSREQKLFSLAAAVRKMTGLSALRFGLHERGFVRQGYWADLVLFDADTVRDAASFTDPMQPAHGIDAVWVNGKLAYRGSDKKATGERAGHFLARSPRTAEAGQAFAHD
ncbi:MULTISPECIES: amidohydrolase family protein [unclassified Herbaspirillum]|uniref:N-acyl-D-amino-acid deacylase family protein n=1 Tax=unclassified Herbaspirillum TaxID=2624150 RepID=UPI00114E3B36|nr:MULTISPECIES: D-aminoacylase [unclassified Herbaspirillum]MBB5392186.1 N-acyl-D-amino-acid deacylase [Herbaspirillum sp. SJZ102]TQK13643.1 N-acyl-D-amino-acid deacylase [Herbaspirillum sp. SJZ130]TQK15646.1 N-acyl-D-amino-acid deacylase [Herbaspirillum sp. SJZ106]TWC71545.1 N-acyl-D-amino-acid deacylase [Herbaspirillum sp. SJZ099]